MAAPDPADFVERPEMMNTTTAPADNPEVTVEFAECAHKLALSDGSITNALFAKDRYSTVGIEVFVALTSSAALQGRALLIDAVVVDAKSLQPVHVDALTWRQESGARLLTEQPRVTATAPCFRGRVHIWHPRASASPAGHRRYAQFRIIVRGMLDGALAFQSEPSYPFVWQVKVSAHTPLVEHGTVMSTVEQRRGVAPSSLHRALAGKRGRSRRLTRREFDDDDGDEEWVDTEHDASARAPSPLGPLLQDEFNCEAGLAPAAPLASMSRTHMLLNALVGLRAHVDVPGREKLQQCIDLVNSSMS